MNILLVVFSFQAQPFKSRWRIVHHGFGIFILNEDASPRFQFFCRNIFCNLFFGVIVLSLLFILFTLSSIFSVLFFILFTLSSIFPVPFFTLLALFFSAIRLHLFLLLLIAVLLLISVA